MRTNLGLGSWSVGLGTWFDNLRVFGLWPGAWLCFEWAGSADLRAPLRCAGLSVLRWRDLIWIRASAVWGPRTKKHAAQQPGAYRMGAVPESESRWL